MFKFYISTLFTILMSFTLVFLSHAQSDFSIDCPTTGIVNSEIYNGIVVTANNNNITKFEFRVENKPRGADSPTLSQYMVNVSNNKASISVVLGNLPGAYKIAIRAHYKKNQNPNSIPTYYTKTIIAMTPIINDLMVTNGGSETNVWLKFLKTSRNETLDDSFDDVPSIVDFSYAGYKQGEVKIPEINDQSYRVLPVTSYGAIPDDNRSDTQAIRNALTAARTGRAIVYFPPGQYDVLMEGEALNQIIISGSHTIIKGSGSQGASMGGTTIKQHRSPRNWLVWLRLFKTQWRTDGFRHGTPSNVNGTFTVGSKHFDLQDASVLSGKNFLEIRRHGIKDADFNQYSSRPIGDMHSSWQCSASKNGINVQDTYEIDKIENNRVYIKASLHSNIDSNYRVAWKEYSIGIGFEDIHIDGGFNESYRHHGGSGHYSYGGIGLSQTAHSWVRRVRLSNCIDPLGFSDSIHNTAKHIIIDGKKGHFPAQIVNSSHCIITFLEDRTDSGCFHGVSVQSSQTGNVFYALAGARLKGPDGHGSFPRNTLFDNMFSVSHEDGGGTPQHKPRHLNGYIRWNNSVSYTGGYDFWGGSHPITQAIIVGYKHSGTQVQNAYVESYNTYVSPESLYVAQLNRRLGYTPQWVIDLKSDHIKFYEQTYNRKYYSEYSLSPKFPVWKRTPQVQAAILATFSPPKTAYELTYKSIQYTPNLSLSNKGITSLKEGDFDGMPRLRTIDLRDNNLTSLPDKVFHDVRSLEYLYINNNNLTEIQADLFKDTKLRSLNLSNNSISKVDKNAFNGLKTLQTLILSHNQLANMPRNALVNMLINEPSETKNERLVNLYLNNNNLNSINKGFFEGIVNLNYLDLRDNNTNPINFTVAIHKNEDYMIRLYLDTAAPSQVVVPITVLDGTFDGDATLTIEAGKSYSPWLQVATNNVFARNTIVDIGTLPDNPANHYGYELTKSSDLPITVIDSVVRPAPQNISVPQKTEVFPNFPNPFNPETWIPYNLAKSSVVTLTIFDSKGVVVRNINIGIQKAGYYNMRSTAIHWDGQNELGENVANGIYFYKMNINDKSSIRKMIIIK